MSMRLLRSSALALLLSAALVQATDIDTGFTQDGNTTYCEGITSDSGSNALAFPNLNADSVGRCPVGVSMAASATTIHLSDSISMTWSSFKNSAVTNSIFPNAIDTATGLPGNVLDSWMKACLSGTNCATSITPTTVGSTTLQTGAYDSDGTKDLCAYSFKFTATGTYIIVGKVTLPGDSTLNVSGTEYIAFLSVTVVDDSATITATPTPTPTPTPSRSSSSSSSGSGSGSVGASEAGSASASASTLVGDSEPSVGVVSDSDTSSESSSPSATTKASSSDGSSSGASASTSSSSSSSMSSGLVLVACVVGGLFMVAVLGMAFVTRRRQQRANANKRDNGAALRAMGGAGAGAAGAGAAATVAAAAVSRKRTEKEEDSEVYILNNTGRSNEAMAEEAPPLSVDSIAVLPTPSPPLTRGSEMMESPAAAPKLSAASDLSSLDSEQCLDSVSNYEESFIDDDNSGQNYSIGSLQWKESEYARSEDSSVGSLSEAPKGRGFSVASSSSDYSIDNRPTRLESEVSVDSYGFRPSRVSAADSYSSRVSGYTGGYSPTNSSRRGSAASTFSTTESLREI